MNKYLSSLFALVTPTVARAVTRRAMPHGALDAFVDVECHERSDGSADRFDMTIKFTTGTCGASPPVEWLEQELVREGIALPSRKVETERSAVTPPASIPRAKSPRKKPAAKSRR